MEKQKERAAGKNLISFGAPGTGKSYSIKKEMRELYEEGICPSCLGETSKEDIDDKIAIRTTFHPDSDYSTFVGCYKPRKVGDVLTYEFTPQAFVNAYVNAWKTNEPYFLIIEEINRGNCAQIFGDIFQVLDRKADGEHEYSIKPDTDLETYLREEGFKDFSNWPEIPVEIREGKILYLPKNLTILATMNTSDQSLFPMDSAFKRRWEWHYVPIKDWGNNHGIKIGEKNYDWFGFITKINQKIVEVTEADDKQIGYWFVKFKESVNGLMDAETFVSKVIFYLWMDVFKDMGRNENSPFSIKKNYIDDGDDAKNEKTDEDSVFWGFKDFIDSNGEANTRRIQSFLDALGINDWIKNDIKEESQVPDNNTLPEDPIHNVIEESGSKRKKRKKNTTFTVVIKGKDGWESPREGEDTNKLMIRLLEQAHDDGVLDKVLDRMSDGKTDTKRFALNKTEFAISHQPYAVPIGNIWYDIDTDTDAKIKDAKLIQEFYAPGVIMIEGPFEKKKK